MRCCREFSSRREWKLEKTQEFKLRFWGIWAKAMRKNAPPSSGTLISSQLVSRKSALFAVFQLSLNAIEQVIKAKRFCDVVIGTQLETLYLIS